jgi:hypothetical protein
MSGRRTGVAQVTGYGDRASPSSVAVGGYELAVLRNGFDVGRFKGDMHG